MLSDKQTERHGPDPRSGHHIPTSEDPSNSLPGPLLLLIGEEHLRRRHPRRKDHER